MARLNAVALRLWIETVGQRLATQPRQQVARRLNGHRAARGMTGACHVRRDERVGQTVEWVAASMSMLS